MKSSSKLCKIIWPERYIEGARIGPSIVLPLRVAALMILGQAILTFFVFMSFIGFLNVFKMAIRKLSLKEASFGSLEIDHLKVKKLQIEEKA
ncbi:MAG TPA: hypothetical protein PLE24_11960 [Chitinispirillaceae bacterium]|jgi:hypothetical protein|nr:hypothetical protein [Chitinispirillaceae bacterium]